MVHLSTLTGEPKTHQSPKNKPVQNETKYNKTSSHSFIFSPCATRFHSEFEDFGPNFGQMPIETISTPPNDNFFQNFAGMIDTHSLMPKKLTPDQKLQQPSTSSEPKTNDNLADFLQIKLKEIMNNGKGPEEEDEDKGGDEAPLEFSSLFSPKIEPQEEETPVLNSDCYEIQFEGV